MIQIIKESFDVQIDDPADKFPPFLGLSHALVGILVSSGKISTLMKRISLWVPDNSSSPARLPDLPRSESLGHCLPDFLVSLPFFLVLDNRSPRSFGSQPIEHSDQLFFVVGDTYAINPGSPSFALTALYAFNTISW